MGFFGYSGRLTMIDNKTHKLGDTLKEHIRSGDTLSIISAYTTLYAFDALKKELGKLGESQVLFSQDLVSTGNIGKLVGDTTEIPLRNELNQKQIAKEFRLWIEEKCELREMRGNQQALSNLFHIKKKSDENIGIQGNSNFTSAGLGYSFSDNFDMNLMVTDSSATAQILGMFQSAWDNSVRVKDVKKTILDELDRITTDSTPEQIYYFTLYHLFKEFVEDVDFEQTISEKTGFKDSIVWSKLYNFQRDGVMGAIEKLEKYKGCIIADSVGLGKTFEALAIIKYYELRNGRVLVLAPKKLRDNWATYTLNDKRNLLVDDRFSYDILNHSDLTRTGGKSGDINLETIHWSNYDLVVIDESHNFRNSSKSKEGRHTRYSKMMQDIIKKGVRTKVLMLSATPVNSKLNDLKNQIAFITEGYDGAFENDGITSYEDTLKQAQKRFNIWMKDDPETRTTKGLLSMLRFDYFKLLDMLTIARSRQHIQKYYDMGAIGTFPNRLPPIPLRPAIDLKGEFPSIRELDKVIRRLHLAPYSPLKYVLPHKQEEYDNRYDNVLKNNNRVLRRQLEQNLIHLMRVNLLKRMESSIFSFHQTVYELLFTVDAMLEKIHNHKHGNYDCPSIEEIDLEDDEYSTMLMGSAKVKVLLEDCDLIKWKEELERDSKQLTELLQKSEFVTPTRDNKLNELKQVIRNKIETPLNEGNKKVIVFTAFADTAGYLYDHIAAWAQETYGIHTALVTGSKTNKSTLPLKRKDLSAILTNFSPISKERDKVDESPIGDIDILIATDCISEGQNLQDCDMVVNYDIHWNPVRIIQRFGRIDRLGSKNSQIQLVSFWPDIELDEYINLEARVSGRMVLLDVSATGEENIIDTSQDAGTMNDLKYRKKQLEQLQNSVIDLEDISGGITITDLTLNDFRMDLSNYLKGHSEEELEQGIKGSFAVVDHSTLEDNTISAGALFCFRQTGDAGAPDPTYPLAPYYLVYIKDDGSIQYAYTETRQILDVLRRLCNGETELLRDALELFNGRTDDETDMTHYAGLLKEAVYAIIGKEEENGLDSLFDSTSDSLGAGNLAPNTFECISWLAIV